jgi:hypothetical protein
VRADLTPMSPVGRYASGFSRCIRHASIAAIAGLSLAGLFAQGGVNAQTIVSPPQPFPLEVTVFPTRDFVHLGGFVPNSDLVVKLKRGTTVVSTAQAHMVFDSKAGAWGADINHAPPNLVCWQGVTPIIAQNDVVEVTYDATTANNQALVTQGVLPASMLGSGYSTRTSNVTAQQAYIDNVNLVAGQPVVVVKGRAMTGNNPTPLARVEVLIRNKGFKSDPGSRFKSQDIRANTATAGGFVIKDGNGRDTGARGLLAADPACLGCFIARFTGLNATERALAVDPFPNATTMGSSWQLTDAAGNALGLTIYEVGNVHGPGDPTCPNGPNGPVPANAPAAPVAYDVLNLTDSKVPPADLTALHPLFNVFPSRDFVSADGYPIGIDLQFVVRRWDQANARDVIVGTARGTTAKSDPITSGILEANHPGGVCWSGQTPDIKPGDKIDIFQVVNGAYNPALSANSYKGETQEVIGVAVTGKYVDADGKLVITGVRPTGWNLTLMEQRIVQPGFLTTVGSRIIKRDIRADTTGGRVDGAGGTGFLEQTSDTTWKATYTGLNATELQLALDGDIRVMAWWSADAAGNRFGVTIFEYNLAGGPGFGGCPSTGSFTIPIPPYPPAP